MKPWSSLILALLVSAVAHGLLGLFVYSHSSAPDLGFELTLPAEVEFGLTEGLETQLASTTATSSAEEASEAPPESSSGPEGAGLEDAGVPDASHDDPVDAHVADAETRDADTKDAHIADAAQKDASTEAEAPPEPSTEEPPSTLRDMGGVAQTVRLPAGAQIALRLDLARMKDSPLGDKIRELLTHVEDWRVVLAGSGIEPLDDLDRIMVASPNLLRSRMILAGRYREDRVDVRAVAELMARTHGGKSIKWRKQYGVEVAPWHHEDDTPRVLALWGDRYFSITRPEDLPALLAVAQAKAEILTAIPADADPHTAPGTATTVADPVPSQVAGRAALLAMPANTALTLEVEGARRFARGDALARVPQSLQLRVYEMDPSTVGLGIESRFDDPDQASEAVSFWDAVRQRQARNVFVSMMGFGPALSQAEITSEGAEVHVHASLGASRARAALGLLQGMFEQWGAYQRAQRMPPVTPLAPTTDGPRNPTPPPPGPGDTRSQPPMQRSPTTD